MSIGGVGSTDLGASPQGGLVAWRRVLYAVAALAFLCLFASPLFTDLIDHRAPRAVAGELDLGGRWAQARPLELNGQWRLEWLSAGPHQPAPRTTGIVQVPGPWRGQRLGALPLPEHGAAAYSLLLRGLAPGRYALHVPTLYEATRVSIDGEPLSQRGLPGLTPATTRYEVRAHDVTFATDGSPVRLRIDVSAFHHRDNGMEAAPVLGRVEPMGRWAMLMWMRNFTIVASVFLLSTYGIVVFLFRRRDRASLYFALSCLAGLPIAAIFSHDNILLVGFPGLSFQQMAAIQYLSGVVLVAFLLAYTHALFPRESRRWAFLALEASLALLFLAQAAAAIAGDAHVGSHLSQWSMPLRVLMFAYIIGVVVAACLRGRDGAFVFLLGVAVFAVTVVVRGLATNGVIPELGAFDPLPAGMLMLLFSHIVILAERWSLAIEAAEQRTEDLRQLLDVNISITSEMRLEALLRKIVQVTSKVIQADRSSLFLHDPKRDVLWSVVAEGVETPKIEFPASEGLAGHAFQEGRAIRVADAYADPRFNPGVDTETGYRTESALSVPVTARDGRRLGVMQSLNRRHGRVFDDTDQARMSAFAAQAAVAIDNATLFAEVAAERNYNESILRSMSSGVVTLDREARVAKLNLAACAILQTTAEEVAGVDARAWLAAQNPWLIAEVDLVAQSGQPKTLLDADLKTAQGRTISVNLSIVPLLADGGPLGLLILIEDITEGKRLQGTIRRFMPQKVMDQVLGREDDLLFGTACEASVLFADIRNFSGLTEVLQPRDTVDMLNEVFTELFEAVAASDGVLDKFIGDAIMAVYGAPLSSGRDPQNAVQSALQMRRAIAQINAGRRERALPKLGLGVAIATGDVIAGTIGSPKRMDYTVIGDSVNLASRLEGTTKLYGVGILVCETTAAAARADGIAPLRELDLIRVRGRKRPEKIFEVLTPEGVKPEAVEPYEAGRKALVERRWADAVAAFQAAAAADPSDRASAVMLGRAQILRRRPPAADWDGVWESPEAALPG